MTTKIFRNFMALTISTLLLLGLAACANEPGLGGGETNQDNTTTEQKSDETGPIRIGGVMPLTGDGASYGLPAQQAAEIALAKLNENGGVNGRQVEIIWEDGKCNGKDASSAAQKLINVDGVKVILGGFCSSETLSIAPLAEAAGVLLLSPGSSSPDVTDAGDYVFRNYPSDSSQGAVLANIAIERGVEKVGMISEENDYTIGIERVFKETAEAGGVEVSVETFLPTDTEFRTQITKLKGEGVDAIFVNPQTPPKADLILKQLQEAELGDVQLFANDATTSYKEGLDRYPELVEGLIGAEAFYDTEHPEFIYLSNQYTERTGEEMPFPTYMATSFDAVNLLAEGMTAVGHDADALKSWLYTVKDWNGTAGNLTIDQNGDPLSGHRAKIVQDGELALYESTEPEESKDEDMPEEGAAMEEDVVADAA